MEYLSKVNILSPVLGIWNTTIVFMIIGTYLAVKSN